MVNPMFYHSPTNFISLIDRQPWVSNGPDFKKISASDINISGKPGLKSWGYKVGAQPREKIQTFQTILKIYIEILNLFVGSFRSGL